MFYRQNKINQMNAYMQDKAFYIQRDKIEIIT